MPCVRDSSFCSDFYCSGKGLKDRGDRGDRCDLVTPTLSQ